MGPFRIVRNSSAPNAERIFEILRGILEKVLEISHLKMSKRNASESAEINKDHAKKS